MKVSTTVGRKEDTRVQAEASISPDQPPHMLTCNLYTNKEPQRGSERLSELLELVQQVRSSEAHVYVLSLPTVGSHSPGF